MTFAGLVSMGVVGFGYGINKMKQAIRASAWTDPRSVIPLCDMTEKYTLASMHMNKTKTSVMSVVDSAGRIVYVIEHGGKAAIWNMKDPATFARVATIKLGKSKPYFILESDLTAKIYCLPREAGRYREHEAALGESVFTYRWYTQSYHLERVVVEPPHAAGAEETYLYEIVGKCRRVDEKNLNFEFYLDFNRVHVVGALASGFICMMSSWRKAKLVKSQATIDFERDELRLKTKNYMGRKGREIRLRGGGERGKNRFLRILGLLGGNGDRSRGERGRDGSLEVHGKHKEVGLQGGLGMHGDGKHARRGMLKILGLYRELRLHGDHGGHGKHGRFAEHKGYKRFGRHGRHGRHEVLGGHGGQEEEYETHKGHQSHENRKQAGILGGLRGSRQKTRKT